MRTTSNKVVIDQLTLSIIYDPRCLVTEDSKENCFISKIQIINIMILLEMHKTSMRSHTYIHCVCVCDICYVCIHRYYTLTLDRSAGEQHFDPRNNSDNRQPSGSNTLIIGRSIKPYLNNPIIFDRYHASRIKIKHARENYNIPLMCPILKKEKKH